MYDVAMVCVSLTIYGGVHGSRAHQLLLLFLLLQPVVQLLAQILLLVLVLRQQLALFPPGRLTPWLPAAIGLPLRGRQLGRGQAMQGVWYTLLE